MYYNRAMKDCWNQAGQQFPVLLLTGPRQVGKTTLLNTSAATAAGTSRWTIHHCGHWLLRTPPCSSSVSSPRC